MRFRSYAVTLFAVGLVLLGVQNAGATADPLWTKQYGPQQIGAPAAWQKGTGKGVKVSVVDTGVDVDHPDLRPNLLLDDSYDVTCNDNNPDDKVSEGGGHGTHVSGTIAAVANNNIGVAGVAPDVKLMVMRVGLSGGGCGGVLGLTAISQAISRSVDRGAKIINLSLADNLNLPGLEDSVTRSCEQAFAQGSLCIVASGNSGETKSSGYRFDFNAVVVTANDSTGRHAGFGQKADTKWSVSAPGVAVLSTWPMDDPAHDGYNSIQGTSMAAPHVAGAAAILSGLGMSNRQIAEQLVKTAGPARDASVEGAGIIHIDRAVGLETATTLAPTKGAPAGTVTKSGRSGAAGGSAAIPPRTTSTTTGVTRTTVAGVDFEAGLEDNESFEAIRLREASRNSANKPFNVAGPLVGISAVAGIALIALAIPRLRSKDQPPLT